MYFISRCAATSRSQDFPTWKGPLRSFLSACRAARVNHSYLSTFQSTAWRIPSPGSFCSKGGKYIPIDDAGLKICLPRITHQSVLRTKEKNGKPWGREVAAQRETKYIQCFHDCPIMESSSNSQFDESSLSNVEHNQLRRAVRIF